MKIDLNKLNYQEKIEINQNVIFPLECYQNSQIKNLKDVFVKGYIYLDALDDYACNLTVFGQMTLLDSVTLENVDLPFEFEISEKLDESLKNNQNSLDIIELLWQNIVLEVPIRYTKSDAQNLSGDNWKVCKENEEEKIDPRMQKLYDLYKGGE